MKTHLSMLQGKGLLPGMRFAGGAEPGLLGAAGNCCRSRPCLLACACRLMAPLGAVLLFESETLSSLPVVCSCSVSQPSSALHLGVLQCVQVEPERVATTGHVTSVISRWWLPTTQMNFPQHRQKPGGISRCCSSRWHAHPAALRSGASSTENSAMRLAVQTHSTRRGRGAAACWPAERSAAMQRSMLSREVTPTPPPNMMQVS